MHPEIQNYIFDFYGTLVDILTDEASLLLWRRMATYYSWFGAPYRTEEIMERYLELCREESDKAARQNGSRYPEPDLGTVFRRLLTEKEPAALPGDMDMWIRSTARMFRIISRKRFSVFKDSIPVLKTLRQKGKKVFLLSNAQELLTRPEIEEAGLSRLFDGIYISSEKGVAKPDPAFLLMLMKEYSLDPEESIIIGDNMGTDVRLADMCGMRSVFLYPEGYSEKQFQQNITDCSIRFPDRITRIEKGSLYRLLRII